MQGRWPVGSYEERRKEERRGGRKRGVGEGNLRQLWGNYLQKSEKRGEEGTEKEKSE